MAKTAGVSKGVRKAGKAGDALGLCTPAERRLLALSDAKSLAVADPAGVKAALGRAREARDKWRAVSSKQDRGAKRSPRAVADANARSRAKAELFAAAVKRFETHLATVSAPAVSVGHRAPRKTPKKLRAAGNRTSRAGVRAEMRRTAAETRAKTAARPAAKAAAPAVVKAAAPAVAPEVATVLVRGAAATSRSGKARPPVAPSGGQAVGFDAAKQRSLRAAAKNSRLTAGGLTTRRTSHVVATGRRSQARRDGRGGVARGKGHS